VRVTTSGQSVEGMVQAVANMYDVLKKNGENHPLTIDRDDWLRWSLEKK
jgi:hypothetical protein